MIKKIAEKYFERVNTFEQFIFEPPQNNLSIIVVIPVFNEPYVYKTLQSLMENKYQEFATEIIFVVNSAQNSPQEVVWENNKSVLKLKQVFEQNNNSNLFIHILNIKNLPVKKSGVGVARKIGMDEALRRFASLNKSRGIIVNLDADTLVEKNYLQEIYSTFEKNIKIKAANIHFEHPICGNEFSDDIYKAIQIYEIYLRYYVEALNFTKYPYAFQTVGSAFCCTAEIYAKQGGMVTNQAGEDFYFLQKIIPVSNFINIKTTKVKPSPRITNRVVFGTGVAVKQIINLYNFDFPTYSFDTFLNLKIFFAQLEKIFTHDNYSVSNLQLHKSLEIFLIKNKFETKIEEIKRNTKHFESFKKRFYTWFNAFKIIKYLNYAHSEFYKKSSLMPETEKLFEKLNINFSNNTKKTLQVLRNLA